MYKLGCPESPPNVRVCELNLLVENVLLSGDMTDARSLLRGLRGRIRGVARCPGRDASLFCAFLHMACMHRACVPVMVTRPTAHFTTIPSHGRLISSCWQSSAHWSACLGSASGERRVVLRRCSAVSGCRCEQGRAERRGAGAPWPPGPPSARAARPSGRWGRGLR